ncbi:uncharacterized protein DUF397 [Nocardiopsis sp. L17-MgMaSL7]|nr:uncharacterized protein DUF397 [Nocardiopsis sp. L17-MgMaSL7]
MYPHTTELTFHKSSYSNPQNCVEVADLPTGAAVRDTKTGNVVTWRSRRRSGARSSPEFDSADQRHDAGPRFSPGVLGELFLPRPNPKASFQEPHSPQNPGLDLGLQAHPGTGSQPPPRR